MPPSSKASFESVHVEQIAHDAVAASTNPYALQRQCSKYGRADVLVCGQALLTAFSLTIASCNNLARTTCTILRTYVSACTENTQQIQKHH